jgi:hypothetical protein
MARPRARRARLVRFPDIGFRFLVSRLPGGTFPPKKDLVY